MPTAPPYRPLRRNWPSALLAVLLCSATCCSKDAPVDGEASLAGRVEQLVKECYDKRPDVPWISLADYTKRSKDEDWVIVDVRAAREREVSVIPGCITTKDVEAQMESHRKKMVLVYCTVGGRSGAYTRELRKKGLKAHNLRGGVLAWALAGRAFVTPDGKPTRRVHVYAKKWNVLPPEYEGVWQR